MVAPGYGVTISVQVSACRLQGERQRTFIDGDGRDSLSGNNWSFSCSSEKRSSRISKNR